MKKQYPIIDMKRTGQNIKHIMQSKKFTVKDVQVFLGLSTPQSIYHWFDGRSLPTVDNLYALSELFEIPMDYIVCGSREYKGSRYITDFNTRMMEYYIRIAKTA